MATDQELVDAANATTPKVRAFLALDLLCTMDKAIKANPIIRTAEDVRMMMMGMMDAALDEITKS